MHLMASILVKQLYYRKIMNIFKHKIKIIYQQVIVYLIVFELVKAKN